MSQNICIAGTAKGVIDTSVTEIYKGVACYDTFVTATIQIFCFCQILYLTILRIYRCNTVEVDRCAVFRVERIAIVTLTIDNRSTISIVSSLAYNTLLATAEYL